MNEHRYSNQQVINAFYYAIRKLYAGGQAPDPWQVILDHGLASLADHRQRAYDCPPIDQLGIDSALAQAISDELAAMPPAFENSSLVRPEVMLNVPWISQLDNDSIASLDCGHACVLMLLQYYDNPPSPGILSNMTVDQLVELMRVIDVQKGRQRRAENLTSTQDLVDLAAANGLTLTADRAFATPERALSVLTNHRPIILLVNYKDLKFPPHLRSGDDQGFHWLVVVGYGDDGSTFVVHDPLWMPGDRNRRGGRALSISRENLANAMRENSAVY